MPTAEDRHLKGELHQKKREKLYHWQREVRQWTQGKGPAKQKKDQ